MNDRFCDMKEYEMIKSLISTDPLGAISRLEEYLTKYPRHHTAINCYITVLIMLSKFEEAEKVSNDLEQMYNKDEMFKKNIGSSKYFEIIFAYNKLKILSFLGKYEELYEFYKDNYIILKDKLLRSDKVFIELKSGIKSNLNRDEEDSYLVKQMIRYDKSDFKRHIQEHFFCDYDEVRQTSNSVFSPGFPVYKVITEIKKNIPSDKKICNALNSNVYIFKLDNCGVVDGNNVDYLRVVCFHNTKNLITVYPIKDSGKLPYTDINYIMEENESENKDCMAGDLVEINEERYLVRKVIDGKYLSLVKLVSKEQKDISFEHENEHFYALKNDITGNISNVQLIKSYGKEIIDAFEKVKKNQKNKNNRYNVGNIIVIKKQEKLVIDIVDSSLILVDTDYNLSCVTKYNTYDIVYSMAKKDVNLIKNKIKYNDEKRNNVLLNNKKNKRK